MTPKTWLRRARSHAGFTMIEMLIVVALVGIIATIALPNFRNATLKAKEAVLREDLWVLRDVLDQYHTDKARYPASLEELVTSGYIRKIPVDPITGSADTWEVSYEPLAEDELAEEEAAAEDPGITDVHSGSTAAAMDGSYYGEW